jgi:DNA replication licensing factor MCM4
MRSQKVTPLSLLYLSDALTGETPCTVSIFAFDSLVDSVRPGDRIEVTGIYRAIPRRSNAHMRTLKTIYRTYLDAIHFRRSNQTGSSSSMNGDLSLDPLTQLGGAATATEGGIGESLTTSNSPHLDASSHFPLSRIQEFEEFCQEGDVYNRLIASFAPSIWELEDVKKGILCQLFGGTSQRQQQVQQAQQRQTLSQTQDLMSEGDFEGQDGEGFNHSNDKSHQKNGYQRSDINILLCGDPGTSKSQLLSYVHKVPLTLPFVRAHEVSSLCLLSSVDHTKRNLHKWERKLRCWSHRLCHPVRPPDHSSPHNCSLS